MKTKRVVLKSRDGLKLVGVLSIPKGRPPFPTIVMCHGYSSSKDSESYTTLEKLLLPLGVASFRLDYRAHGESEGSWEDLTVGGVKNDIGVAVDYLLTYYKQKIDRKKIIIYGASFSGLPVVWLASENKKVRYLICRSGVIDSFRRYKRLYDLKKWKKKGWIRSRCSDGSDLRYSKYSYKIIEEVSKLKVKTIVARVKIPTLIIHGTADKEVLPYHSRFLYKHLGSKDKTLKLVEGVDHWYHGKRNELQRIIVGWIKEKVLD